MIELGLRFCGVAGCMALTQSARCAEHERAHQKQRNRQPGRKPRRTRVYMDTPLGTRCVCCQATTDLTRHHVSPLYRGPGPDLTGSPLLVTMCRSCNSSIGSKLMTDHRCPRHGGTEAAQ